MPKRKSYSKKRSTKRSTRSRVMSKTGMFGDSSAIFASLRPQPRFLRTKIDSAPMLYRDITEKRPHVVRARESNDYYMGGISATLALRQAAKYQTQYNELVKFVEDMDKASTGVTSAKVFVHSWMPASMASIVDWCIDTWANSPGVKGIISTAIEFAALWFGPQVGIYAAGKGGKTGMTVTALFIGLMKALAYAGIIDKGAVSDAKQAATKTQFIELSRARITSQIQAGVINEKAGNLQLMRLSSVPSNAFMAEFTSPNKWVSKTPIPERKAISEDDHSVDFFMPREYGPHPFIGPAVPQTPLGRALSPVAAGPATPVIPPTPVVTPPRRVPPLKRSLIGSFGDPGTPPSWVGDGFSRRLLNPFGEEGQHDHVDPTVPTVYDGYPHVLIGGGTSPPVSHDHGAYGDDIVDDSKHDHDAPPSYGPRAPEFDDNDPTSVLTPAMSEWRRSVRTARESASRAVHDHDGPMRITGNVPDLITTP